MASLLSEDEFCCPLCYKIFEDPVILSCSHSFCRACVERWWTVNPKQECPVCKTRSPSRNPPRNLALRSLCEAFSQQGLQTPSSGSEEVCSLHSEKLQLFCLDHQQPVCLVCRDSEEHIYHSFRPINEAARGHKAEVQQSLGPLQEKLNVLQKAKGDWLKTAEQKVHAQETEGQIIEDFKKFHKVLQEEQEARICALREEVEGKSEMAKEKVASLNREIKDVLDSIRAVEKQLEAPDVSFLQNYKAMAQITQRLLSKEPQGPSEALINVNKHLGNQKLTSLVKELQQNLRSVRLECVSYAGVWMNSGLRKYSCKLTLDPNTAHRNLHLSEQNQRVTRGAVYQPYPDHPGRFDWYTQVLCREAISQRCYWEVEWATAGAVRVGVTYMGIPRKVKGHDCGLGWNDASWSLQWSCEGYVALHDQMQTPISLSLSSSSVSSGCHRVGVYVDWPAGSLSFYTVSSDTLTHLHTFCCRFTQALIPGLYLGPGSSVSLCQVE